MIKNYHLLLILFVIFIIFCESTKYSDNKSEHLVIDLNNDDNVGFDLKSVQTMTFFKNRLTKGNRTDPINQLNCVGGNACNMSHLIQSIQCKNNGTNENDDVQWECSTNIPSNLSLGKTNVNCEGLTNNLDKIKLKGSCGLEYTLNNSNNSSSYSYTSISIIIILILLVVFICFAINSHPIRYYNGYSYAYPEYYSPYYSRRYYDHDYDYGYRRSSYGSSNNDFSSSTGFGSTKTR